MAKGMPGRLYLFKKRLIVIILIGYYREGRKGEGSQYSEKCDMSHKCDVTYAGLSQPSLCLAGIFLLRQFPINRLAAYSQ